MITTWGWSRDATRKVAGRGTGRLIGSERELGRAVRVALRRVVSGDDRGRAVLRQLAADSDGPLVELAIGNGRVAIPVALATGRTVIGIDSSPAMLAQARTAAAAAGVALDMVICQIVLLMLGSLLDAASRTSPGPARYATPRVPSLRLAGAATERRYEPSPTAGLTAAPNHGSRAQGSGEPTLLPQRDRSAGRSIIGDLTQRSASDQSRGAWRRPPLGRMRPSESICAPTTACPTLTESPIRTRSTWLAGDGMRPRSVRPERHLRGSASPSGLVASHLRRGVVGRPPRWRGCRTWARRPACR